MIARKSRREIWYQSFKKTLEILFKHLVFFSVDFLTGPKQIDIKFMDLKTYPIKFIIPMIFEIIDSNHIGKTLNPTLQFKFYQRAYQPFPRQFTSQARLCKKFNMLGS